MTRHALIICAALMAPLVLPVMAQPVDVPRELPAATTSVQDTRPEIKDLLPQGRLVGKGRLTFFGFQVYDARLWSVPGFKADNFASQPFALELAYLRDFKNRAVAERSIHEMRRSANISDAQAGATDAWPVRLRAGRTRTAGAECLGDRLLRAALRTQAASCGWSLLFHSQETENCLKNPIFNLFLLPKIATRP